MRYLKRFNEELKPQTYKNAAVGLNKLGHTKRATDLNDWSEVSRQKEIDRKFKEMVDLYSKHGVFKMVIDQKVFNFYLFFEFDSNSNAENWQDWEKNRRFEGDNLWMVLDVCLIPADEECLKFSLNNLDYYKASTYYAGTIGIKLSDAVGFEKEGTENDEDLPYDSGQWELDLSHRGNVFYVEGNEISIKFVNRLEANKFRKLIIDVFEGNVEMGETSDWPGGVKEKIIDFYCNKKGVSIEEFENMVDSLKRITVNSLYKD